MDNEQILELFNDLVSGKRPNGQFQLLRIYGAYEREMEEIQRNKSLDEQLKSYRKRYVIHRISDDIAIVEYHGLFGKDDICFSPALNDRISNNVYDSFDKALIASVALKAGDIEASGYVFKMFGM